MGIQAWICPHCFDDHSMRDCYPQDLRAVIDKLRQENEFLKRQLYKQQVWRDSIVSRSAAMYDYFEITGARK